MHKTLALSLLLIASPVLADTDVPQVPSIAQESSTAVAAERAVQPAELPVVAAPSLPEAPANGWADRVASMISIFAGVVTVLLIAWKTLSNRARQRRQQQGKG